MSSSKKVLSQQWFVIAVLLIIMLGTWLVVAAIIPGSLTLPPTSTPSTFFEAVVREDLICSFENSKNDAKAFILKYKIVGVIGKNTTGEWVLIRSEDFADCWAMITYLDLQGNNIDILPIVNTSSPPETIFLLSETAQPTEEPTQPTEEPTQPTEEPTQPTEEPLKPAFDVDVDVIIIECACGRRSGKAIITLTFNDGEAPYDVNGQTPVNGNTVSFDTILGISIPLRVVSSDGQIWEEVVSVSYCSLSVDQCSAPGNDPIANTPTPAKSPTPTKKGSN